MASLSLISDDLNAYSDNSTLDSTTDWEVYKRSGGGNMTSDQHTDHAPDQVIDMSNTGYSDAVFVTDTLDDADQRAQIAFWPDTATINNGSGVGNAEAGVLLRLQDNNPVDTDGYEILAHAYEDTNTNEGNTFRIEINKIVAGTRTTLQSVSNALDNGRTEQQYLVERSGMVIVEGSIVGTTITAYLNGREITSTTDSTYSTGSYTGFSLSRITSGTFEQPFVSHFRAWTPNETSAVYEDTPWVLWNGVENHGTGFNSTDTGQTRPIETPTAGNTLLVIAGLEDLNNDSASGVTVTDSASGTWTQEASVTETTSSLEIYSLTAAGTETTVTVTPDTSSVWNWTVIEIDSAWDIETASASSGGTTSGTLSSDAKVAIAAVMKGTENDPSPTTFDRPLLHQIGQSGISDGVTQHRFAVAATDLGTATTAFTVEPNDSTESYSGYVILAKSAGSSPQTWTGSTGSVSVTGTSGTFVAGAVTWTGSAGAVSVTGTSGSFTAQTTWTGSTGSVAVTGTSGTFVPGAVTWTGSTGSVTVTGTSGTFVPGAVTWTGTTGSVAVTGTSGSFTTQTTWTGTTGAVSVTGTSGSFVAGTTTWTGSAGAIAVTGTSGSFVAGTTTWTGTTGSVSVTGTSGSFVAAGAPQTWTGTAGAIDVTGTSGGFVAGTTTWTGTTGSVAVTGTSGSFVAGGAPQTWTGSTGSVSVTGTSGSFVAGTTTWTGSTGSVAVTGTSGAFVQPSGPQTWTGTTGSVSVAGTSGAFVPGPVTWTGGTASVTVTGTSGSFVQGGAPQTWTGGVGAISVAAVSGEFGAGAIVWTGTPGSIQLIAVSGSFAAGVVAWTGGAGAVAVTGTSGVFLDLSGRPVITAALTTASLDSARTTTSLDSARTTVGLDSARTTTEVFSS